MKILAIFNTIKTIPEIIKQVPSVLNILKRLLNIIKGWYYKIFKKKQSIADVRLAICNKCEYKISTSLGDACKECGCILDAKTRVEDEHCDMNKW